MEVDEWGGWVSLPDFIEAVNSEMEPLPEGEVYFEGYGQGGMSFRERVQKRNRDQFEAFLEEEREAKRNKVIDEEYEWLRNNQLFRGQPPKPGQGWDEFVAEVERRQAEANARGDVPLPVEFPPDVSGFGVPPVEVAMVPDSVGYPVADYPPNPPGTSYIDPSAVVVGDLSGVQEIPDVREDRARYYMENHDAAVRDTQESPFGGSKKKRKRKSPLSFLKSKIFKS